MVSKMQFYLADVEAFLRPLVVIPDMGGNSNDYFLLKSRQDWRERFIDYLEAPNHEYPMEVIDWMNYFEITQYLWQFNCSCFIIKKN